VASACGPRVPSGRRTCHGRTQARVRAWLELEDGPDRRVSPSGEGEEGEERWERVGLGERELGRLGRVGRKKKRPAGLGLAGEKERGEKERESGPSQKRKGGRKRNTFESI
jgi:hypothetical protein